MLRQRPNDTQERCERYIHWNHVLYGLKAPAAAAHHSKDAEGCGVLDVEDGQLNDTHRKDVVSAASVFIDVKGPKPCSRFLVLLLPQLTFHHQLQRQRNRGTDT